MFYIARSGGMFSALFVNRDCQTLFASSKGVSAELICSEQLYSCAILFMGWVTLSSRQWWMIRSF